MADNLNFVSLIFIMTGCSTGSSDLADKNPEEIISKEQQETGAFSSIEEMRNDETPRAEETESDRTAQVETAKGDESSQTGGTETDRNSSGTEGVPSTGGAEAGKIQENNAETTITDAAWSHYFGGINGSAVIYDPALKCYQIYNQELALTRRSPCSTFKIISSLIALENGVIDPEKSIRTWSGETFWNEDWNRDIDFDDAFHASCVWYFRQVIDEIGKDRMQENLDRLQYGNCDISDWEGRLNTNNNNPALTGFWIESSLLISPKEQTEVMERIFGDHTDYREETVSRLEQVMLLTEENGVDISIYGKTGMVYCFHGFFYDF